MARKTKATAKDLGALSKDFDSFRTPEKGEGLVLSKLEYFEKKKDYLKAWYDLSREGDAVYPSQGLLKTPYDYLDYSSVQMLPQEMIIKTLRLRHFFLKLFNHPLRMHYLNIVDSQSFTPPQKIQSKPMQEAKKLGLALAIGDVGASVMGTQRKRVRRAERYAQGPFVKLGKQARSLFVGSASPDVWNSSVAVATMAASHCLSAIPRNGVLHDVGRQADCAKEVFEILKVLEGEILNGRTDKSRVSRMWRANVVGTIEASGKEALKRAESLYKVGVRAFRVYSPEPGTGPLETVKLLRKTFSNRVEIIASLIVDVNQAKSVEEAGADSIIVGIGGGGRCVTGVRSGSVIDWPELVFDLRGEIKIPIIVEGGASDHIAATLLLGASGISVSRIVAGGTIESPGGALFFSDSRGNLFKPYGGEASARIKYLDGKLLPFGIPSFVEGENTKAFLKFGKHTLPTLTYNLHILNEDAILSLVFRGANSVSELHAIDPSPLKRITSFGDFQRNTH